MRKILEVPPSTLRVDSTVNWHMENPGRCVQVNMHRGFFPTVVDDRVLEGSEFVVACIITGCATILVSRLHASPSDDTRDRAGSTE